ncbi:MAG: beta-galactosidase [Lentisphaeria bacterium]|nr:beta-galactosidase [Lentisphaeria bacterium]
MTVPAGNYKIWLYGAENASSAVKNLSCLPGFRAAAVNGNENWQLAGSWNTGKSGRLNVKFSNPVAGLLITTEKTHPQYRTSGIKFQVKSEVLESAGAQKYLPMDENMPYWQSRMAAAPGKWNAVGHSLVRKEFQLSKAIRSALLQITADDQVDEIYINGKKLRGIWTQDWQYPSSVEVAKYLHTGKNLLAIKYTNTGLSGGVMFDLTVNFSDNSNIIVAVDGKEKISFKGNEKNWFAPDFDASSWANTALRNGPPYAPYSSCILPYTDYAVPRGSYRATAMLPADNKREAFRLNLTLQGTPAIGDDEIVYARLYQAKRTRDTQPLCFVSKKLSDLKILERSDNKCTVEINGFSLPEYGGKFDGVIEYGIYHRKSSSKNSIAVTLPDNPYPNSHKPLKVTVDKSGHSPVIKVDGKVFYPVFFSEFYPKYPTGLTGKGSPIKVREFLAGSRTMEWWVGPGKYDFTKIDEIICKIIRDYPESLIAAWVWCQPPHWYDKAYPERISRDSKGKVFPYYMSTVTFSDPEYRKDAAAAIKAFVEHCEKYFGNKMFAYNMAGGIPLEWQGWGCHSMGRRKVFNDYSVAAQRDFLNFAQQRYPELNITQVPTYEERSIARGTAFRDPVKDRAAIIYEEYYSESIADCIAICANAAKKANKYNKLVGAYYGYYFEYGNMAYCVNGAGHNSVYKLLKNPDIDFLLSPPSYGVRAPGEPGADMKVFGSVIAAGKFSIIEDDSRTHLTTKADHHQTVNAFQTTNTLRRNWGMSLARRQPVCMLPIHESRDFSSPEIRRDLGKVQSMGQKLFESNRPSGVEIAVVVDEKALKYLRPDSEYHRVAGLTHYRYSQDGKLQINAHSEQNITGPLTFFQRITLARIGAGSDFIYLEDVPRLADKYKFFIFLADFAASKEFTAAFEALKKRNAGVLIVYGAAFTGRNKDVDAELMSRELGMEFKRINSGALKVNISDATSFAPGELQQLSYGAEYATDPRFAVVDKQAHIMGHYADNKAAALAGKKVGNMQLYFSGSTHLTADLLRALARKSGVFINHNGNDNLFAGYGIYTLYSTTAGKKTIRFPHKAKVVTDVFTGKVLGRNVDRITLALPAHTTSVIYAD